MHSLLPFSATLHQKLEIDSKEIIFIYVLHISLKNLFLKSFTFFSSYHIEFNIFSLYLSVFVPFFPVTETLSEHEYKNTIFRFCLYSEVTPCHRCGCVLQRATKRERSGTQGRASPSRAKLHVPVRKAMHYTHTKSTTVWFCAKLYNWCSLL